jgi:hypothetical protein
MYQLTINKAQAEVLIKALDFYSRIGIGQLEEVANLYQWLDMKRNLLNCLTGSKEIDFELFRKFLNCCKGEIGQPINGSFGIYHPEVPDQFRVSWDIEKVIRHHLAFERHGFPVKRDWDTMMGVDYDEPRQSSQEKLCKIESI